MKVPIALILLVLLGCAPSAPSLVSVDAGGISLHRLSGPSTTHPWSDVEGLQLSSHMIREEGAAPLLVLTVKGKAVEVCSAYPHQVDPKSYAGMHSRISVGKEDFLKIRDAVIAGAGLLPDLKIEGVWHKGGQPGTVQPQEFCHGYTGGD